MGVNLGSVYIDMVEEESTSYSSSATDNALEDNSAISDHVTNNPTTLNISGFILDADGTKIKQINQYRTDATIFDWANVEVLRGVVIEDFSPSHSASIKGGYRYSMTLKQVVTVKRSTQAVTTGQVARMTKNKQNLGLHVPKETAKGGKK